MLESAGMRLNVRWRMRALVLLVCAVLLPWATRLLVGPPGAIVNVRWRPSVGEVERRQLEQRFRLSDGQRLDESTWRYDLRDPASTNLAAIVRAPAVEDTHYIDRARFVLDESAVRSPRRQRLARGSDIVIAIDRLAATLAAIAALLLIIGDPTRVTDAVRSRLSRLPPHDTAIVASDQRTQQPLGWTVAVGMASMPVVIILCLTLWQTPFPLTEAVAFFEDAVEQPATRILSPDKAYYRPLSYLAMSGIWYAQDSLVTTLATVKLMTIAPLLVLLALFVYHLRPQNAVEAGAAIVAVAVLIGSPGFRDNLEIGIYDTLIGMALMLAVWIVLNRPRRAWHAPVIVLCTIVAIGFKEQGLVLVPLVIGAWWARAPGASRGLAATVAAIAVAYIGFRLSGSIVWKPFEQNIGYGFTELDMQDAAARFGAFPYWMYAYNSGSTMANVLFGEPTRGVFQIVQAIIEARALAWHVIQLVSSLALTAVIGWWGIRCVGGIARGDRSLDSRVFISLVLVLLGSGALSFNYSRDRLGGFAVVFYAMAAFFALRAAARRLPHLRPTRFIAAAAVLMIMAAAWQVRVITTLEYTRLHAWGNQREWFVRLPARRIEYARRTTYVRIMEAMVEQGRNPSAPRPTHYPRWIANAIGQPTTE